MKTWFYTYLFLLGIGVLLHIYWYFEVKYSFKNKKGYLKNQIWGFKNAFDVTAYIAAALAIALVISLPSTLLVFLFQFLQKFID